MIHPLALKVTFTSWLISSQFVRAIGRVAGGAADSQAVHCSSGPRTEGCRGRIREGTALGFLFSQGKRQTETEKVSDKKMFPQVRKIDFLWQLLKMKPVYNFCHPQVRNINKPTSDCPFLLPVFLACLCWVSSHSCRWCWRVWRDRTSRGKVFSPPSTASCSRLSQTGERISTKMTARQSKWCTRL